MIHAIRSRMAWRVCARFSSSSSCVVCGGAKKELWLSRPSVEALRLFDVIRANLRRGLVRPDQVRHHLSSMKDDALVDAPPRSIATPALLKEPRRGRADEARFENLNTRESCGPELVGAVSGSLESIGIEARVFQP